MSDTAPQTGMPSLRTIALPVEHGGWGFTLEPVLLGLLVAPSLAAWALAMTAVAVFLARRPIKLVLADVLRNRWRSRTTVAAAFTALYGVIAVAGITGALASGDRRLLVAYGVAVPLALVAVAADVNRKSRTLLAEVCGATAMGATVTAMASAAGWEYQEAVGLWLVLLGRDLTAIVLVREQIRRAHGRPGEVSRVYLVCALAMIAMAALAAAGFVPWLSVLALAGIASLARVSLTRPPIPARAVGWTQMVTGLVVVVLTAVGVRLGW